MKSIKANTGASQKPRFHVYHTFTGTGAFKANTLDEIRTKLTRDQAERFTINDTAKGQFYSVSTIFKDLAPKTQTNNQT